jgi:uncharacterized membrane protein
LTSRVILPLFLSLMTLISLSDGAWAVQSGGRMGGSFGGSSSSRQSSSSGSGRQSSSYYSGGGWGGGGGYYRPRSSTNVIISPGINPYYRCEDHMLFKRALCEMMACALRVV